MWLWCAGWRDRTGTLEEGAGPQALAQPNGMVKNDRNRRPKWKKNLKNLSNKNCTRWSNQDNQGHFFKQEKRQIQPPFFRRSWSMPPSGAGVAMELRPVPVIVVLNQWQKPWRPCFSWTVGRLDKLMPSDWVQRYSKHLERVEWFCASDCLHGPWCLFVALFVWAGDECNLCAKCRGPAPENLS